MAVVFSRRPFGYKLGLFMLFFGTVFFIMGFASPYWYKMYSGLDCIHGGLWQTCVQMVLLLALRMCSDTPKGLSAPSWLGVVQAVQCAALVGLLSAGLYGIIVNWVQRKPTHSRLLELLAMMSSALAFSGCLVFIATTQTRPGELGKLNTTFQYRVGMFRHKVSWALGLNLAASIICLLASGLIAFHNSDIPAHDTPEPLGYTDPQTGAVVYPVIDAASQEVFYIPPPTRMEGFQPMAAGFQHPPAYEAAVASAPPSYSCPSYSDQAAK